MTVVVLEPHVVFRFKSDEAAGDALTLLVDEEDLLATVFYHSNKCEIHVEARAASDAAAVFARADLPFTEPSNVDRAVYD